MKFTQRFVIPALLGIALAAAPSQAADKLKVLLLDGQNNHDWKTNTPILKWILEEGGRFTVDVSTTPPAVPQAPRARASHTIEQKAVFEKMMAEWASRWGELDKTKAELWKQWRPKFADYAVVVSNYNGESWPDEVRADFVKYVSNGGGLVVVHAADNAFGDWPEYNEMIGLGGWGGRNEKSGPMIRWRDGKIVQDTTPGGGGTHGAQHEFVLEAREPEHPILKGLPPRWKHTADELYAKLRGPAKNMTVLATAFSSPQSRGTGEHEPILMVLSYGKGRVFHTTMGHATSALYGLGFQFTLQRGTEWAATGQVTLPAPKPGELSAETAAKREPWHFDGDRNVPVTPAAQILSTGKTP